MPEAIQFLPADELAPERLHAAMVLAFSDYLIGPVKVSLAQWPVLLARQGVDLSLSRAALRPDDGEVLAFSLVAPRLDSRPPRWRLATMGAVPAARGSGAAPALLADLMQRAKAAGLGEVELEVFAQNERARRLYQSRGFEALHELHGYEAPPLGGDPVEPTPETQFIPLEDALNWISTEAASRLTDLPLQVTALSLRANPATLLAWRRGSAQLVYSQPGEDSLIISSLIDCNPAQEDARALLRQLRAAHPAQKIVVHQLQRLDIGGQALRDEGFEPAPLHQLLMHARLG